MRVLNEKRLEYLLEQLYEATDRMEKSLNIGKIFLTYT
jgi:hypothetical protein